MGFNTPKSAGSNGLNADMVRTTDGGTLYTLQTGTVSFSFPASNNLGWTIGTRLRLQTTDPTKYMVGYILVLTSTTVQVMVDEVVGTGTNEVFTLSVAGSKGNSGTNGTNGTNGLPSVTIVSSTTANVISIASKTFSYTSISNLGWAIGSRVKAFNSPGNFMSGVVTAVSSTSVTINIDYISGSGTYISWTLSLTGEKGDTGASGADGLGVPPGGLTNQVLAKIDGTDNNTHWVTPSAGGGGGGTMTVTIVGATAMTSSFTTLHSFTVTSGKKYKIQAYGTFSVIATTLSKLFQITCPSGTTAIGRYEHARDLYGDAKVTAITSGTGTGISWDTGFNQTTTGASPWDLDISLDVTTSGTCQIQARVNAGSGSVASSYFTVIEY